jgi:flagellar basal body rod protein FlgG
MSGSLTLNGVQVKTPKKMKWVISDLDADSTRNAQGLLIRQRIGVKRKIEIEWGPLSDTEVATILNAVSGVFFSVNAPDAQTGGQRSGTFYVGDRTAPVYSFNEKLKALKWEGLSMNIIEQ